MAAPHLPEIAGVIQLAVAPVFLLTAVGTVIAALGVRLGRAVDRRRQLEAMLSSLPEPEAPCVPDRPAEPPMLLLPLEPLTW